MSTENVSAIFRRMGWAVISRSESGRVGAEKSARWGRHPVPGRECGSAGQQSVRAERVIVGAVALDVGFATGEVGDGMRVRQPAERCGVVGRGLLLVGLTAGMSTVWAQYPAAPEVTKDGTAVVLEDYASLPLSSRTTGVYPPPLNFADQLGRVNFLRSEPANAPQSSSRFFAPDNNRNLYILDKTTRTFTPYINYEEVFPKFDNDPGYAGGL
ncbi:MAG: hypothetical protein ACRD1T_26595, partial [Acidimicrobiia bacterium]